MINPNKFENRSCTIRIFTKNILLILLGYTIQRNSINNKLIYSKGVSVISYDALLPMQTRNLKKRKF